VAKTSQAEHPTELANEQTQHLPSEAFYMDCEAALHRAKALFKGIWATANGGLGKDTLSHIIDLASLDEAILEDQLTEDNKEDPPPEAEV